MKGFDWTKADDILLTELWAGGESGREIAAKMSLSQGRPFNKNAVVGRAHRLKLPLRRAPTGRTKRNFYPKPDKVEKPRPKVAAKREEVFLAPRKPNIPMPEFVDKSKAWEVTSLIDMEELDNHTCRWPVTLSGRWDDKADGFCGQRTKDGSSYCAHHAGYAYRPVTKVDRNMGKVSKSHVNT